MSKSETFSNRLCNWRAKHGFSQEDAAHSLGVSRNYVSMLENGREPSKGLLKLFASLENSNPPQETHSAERHSPGTDCSATALRWIPVISWAHAGTATSYDELPQHWQDQIPATYTGARSFGLMVEGDSMEPRCMAGDVVVMAPDEELRNGCLAVAKLRDDGVVLRRFTKLADGTIRLIPYNTLYPAIDYTPRDFHWIYPVHSTVRRELH